MNKKNLKKKKGPSFFFFFFFFFQIFSINVNSSLFGIGL